MHTKQLSDIEIIDWIRLARSVGSITFYSLLAIHRNPSKSLEHLEQLKRSSKKRITIPLAAKIREELEKNSQLWGKNHTFLRPVIQQLTTTGKK